MDPIIKLEHIEFFYDKGKEQQVHALTDVNLEIYPGEYISFLGPSGCGKSTLLYLIAGIERATTGKVLVNHKNLQDFTPKELAIFRQIGIGIIFQNFNLIPSLKNIENITMPMAFLGISEERRKRRALEILERLDMLPFAERYPHELSGGQQQRLGIARALANDPPIILADEPVGNLDSKNAMNVLDILREINEQEGKTIVFVTHEAWSMRDVSRVFYVRDGVITNVEEKKKVEATKKIGSSHYVESLFPELPTADVRAKALTAFLLKGFPNEEKHRFETFLAHRFRGQITSDEFRALLDRSFKDGGVGLWRQRARKITMAVEQAIAEEQELAVLYKKLEHSPDAPLQAEVERIRAWLLEDFTVHLSSTQIVRLHEGVAERIRNVIEPKHFERLLELPVVRGGVGLRVGTSHKVAQKLEFLLAREHDPIPHGSEQLITS